MRLSSRALLLFCLAGPLVAREAESAAGRLEVVRTTSISTVFALVNLKELGFEEAQRRVVRSQAVGGGSFTIVGSSIVYATAHGKFITIDPDGATFRDGALPDLDLGAGAFAHARRINYFESYPRVHDLVESNGTFYVSYDRFDPAADNIRFEIAAIKPSERRWRTIFQSIPLDVSSYTLGNGGVLLVRGNLLYFSIGDYALDHPNNLPSDRAPQNAAMPWGKIHAIDLATLKRSTISIGHRNTLGLIALRDGRLLASENGPRGGDKLMFVTPGDNHGWPWVSGGTDYGTYTPIGDRSKPTAYVAPLFEFAPSIAPTQIAQLDAFDPAWDGDVVMGSLKAGTLFRVRLAADRVLSVEPIVIGERIRAVRQMGRRIVLLTDSSSFVVLELEHDPTLLRRSFATDGVLNLCGSCHSFTAAGGNAFAPTLAGIVGRQIASGPYPSYSAGLLKHRGERWDRQSLAAFLRDPDGFASGTRMPNFHVSDDAIQVILNALATQGETRR